MLNRTFLIGASLCGFFCWLSLLSHPVHAQGRADNNWIFGPNGGIRFNFSNDSLASDPQNAEALGQGSSAVATDPQSGEVLFYTDGSNVYDAQGNTFPIPGGNNNGEQHVAISPIPGSPNEFYLFVTNANGDVEYYEVTVNTTGPGYPQISTFNGPVPANINDVEALTLIPNPDGSSYWLVSKIAGTSTYQYAEITATGVGTTSTYQAGTAGASNIGTSTGMDFNAATNQLAVAGPNGFHILSFDPSTGTFGFVNSSNTPAYDVAWSADGSKLYISSGASGNVFQYNLSNSPPNLTSLTNALGLGGAPIYGLQRGPDGSVYFLYDDAGQFLLGSINSADSAANLLSYETALLEGFDFGGRRFSETAPAAIPNYTFGVNQVGQCANNPVQLVPQFPDPTTPQPDSIVWQIDGQPFSGFSPTFTPEQAASYTATAYWGDTSVTINGGANVGEFDLQIPLVQDTTICPGDVALLTAEPQSGGGQGGGGQGGGGQVGGGNYQYYWSTGETESEIEVDEAGVYWVLVTDPSGCTAYAESNVKEYQVENQTYNVWYFGNNAGIDFNTLYNRDNPEEGGEITPIGDGAQTAPEGVAAVSDGNGDILFYTDGQTVFFKDRETETHVALTDPNGQQAQISPSKESTMVGMVQVPGADGVYYIFTTTPVESGAYELRYSIVDLKALDNNTGLPTVVSSGNLLFSKSTERVTIYGGYGSSAVLVAHEYGNNTFRAYPITEQGIGNPVLSSVGSVHDLTNPEEAQGYMKIGGDATGTVLAVALPDRVELFNFDTQTLEISEPVTIDFGGQNVQPYGIEILTGASEDPDPDEPVDPDDPGTPGSTVLVVSTDNGIYSAVIDRPVVEGSAINISSQIPGSNFGAIQRGPDGQLYAAQEGSSQLIGLSVNTETGQVTQGNNVTLPNGATSGLGLPDYVDFGGNSFPEPAITVDNACVDSEISFSAQGRDDVIEEYVWQITRQIDGLNVSLDTLRTEQSFTFTLNEPGSYIAQVTLRNDCDDPLVLTEPFEVGQAAEITLPESINLCNGEVEVSAIDPNTPDIENYTFTWVQVGATGGGNFPNQNTISISEGGDYTVTVTNADGCENEGSIFVVDNRPEVNLPEDFTLCQGETRELDVEIPSPRRNPSGYEWVILDANEQTVATSEEPVIEVSELTPNPGVYRYTVTVTDDAPEGCFIQDTVVVTIEEGPVLGEPTIENPECGEDDGSITLDLGGLDPSDLSFSWTDPNGSPFIATETATGLASGNYQVTVTNAAGCSFTQTIGLDDDNAPFEIISADGIAGCDNDGFIDLTIDISTLAGAGFFNINITGIPGNFSFQYNTANGTEANYILPAAPSLAPGTYNIQITESASGCRRTTEAEILEPDSVEFEVESVNACGPTATIEVEDYNPATAAVPLYFEWVDPNGTPIVRDPVLSSLTLNAGTYGSGVYTVRAYPQNPNNPLCPGTQEVQVNFGDPFTFNIVEIEPDNSCQTGEKQLTVNFDPEDAANRNLIYNWTLNGQSVGALRTITVRETGSYELSVRERNNSACIYTDELPVVVSQPISVTLLYGNACADGSSIPLFASVRTEGTDSLIYRWFRPDGTRIQASNPPPTGAGDSLNVLSDMPEGQYRVEVETFLGGCIGEATARISRNPLPEGELGATRIICTQDPDPEVNSALLEVGFAPEIYWTTPKGDFVNTTNVVADVAGTYIVEMVNEFGCSLIDSVEVVDDCRPRIVAPNAFRPGGTNNTFFVYPKYVAADDFEVRIYNRWGELIYHSNDLNFQWDGTYRGQDAPLGTYPYVIKYKSSTDETGNLLEQRGGVAIIR